MEKPAVISLNNAQVYAYDIVRLSDADRLLVAECLPKRAARAHKFYFEEDRDRCLAAGLLLIKSLGLKSEEQLSYGPNGKPYLQDAHFNLSHSGTYVVLAIGDAPLGVDIERVEEKHLSVARRVFAPSELMWMEGNSLERFHVLWTQKESVMKLTGQGLSLDPRSFIMDPPGLTSRTCVNGRNVLTESVLLGDYVLSVACFRK